MRTKEEVIREVEHLTEIHSTIREVDEVYFETLIQETKHYKLWDELVHLYITIANIYSIMLGKKDTAGELFCKAEILLKKCSNKIVQARYYSAVANKNLQEGNIKLAFEMFNKSIIVFESLGMLSSVYEKKLKHIVYYSLALLFSKTGEINKSNYCLIKAKRLASLINSKIYLANCYSQLGRNYVSLNKMSIAENYLRKAKSLYEGEQNSYSFGMLLLKFSDYYETKKMYLKALEFRSKGMDIVAHHFPKFNLALSHARIAILQIRLKMKSKAIKSINNSIQELTKVSAVINRINILELHKTYYELSKDYKKANQCYKTIDELRQIENSSELQIKMKELDLKYQKTLQQMQVESRIKKQRETEQFLQLEQARSKRTREIMGALSKSLKNPVQNGKRLLAVLSEEGISKKEKEAVLNELKGALLKISQFQEALKSSLLADTSEGIEEILQVENVLTLLSSRLNGESPESRLSKISHPKTHFVQQYIYALAEGGEQEPNQIISKQPNISAVLI